MTTISTLLPLHPTVPAPADGASLPASADFSAALADAPGQHDQPGPGHPLFQAEPCPTKLAVAGNAVSPGKAPPVLSPSQLQSTAHAKQLVSRSDGGLSSRKAIAADLRPDEALLPPRLESIANIATASPAAAERITIASSPAEVTWTRLFAQHWLANGYLSLVVQPDAQAVLAEPVTASGPVSKTSLPVSPPLRASGLRLPRARVEGDLPLPEPMPEAVRDSREQETMGMADRLSRSLAPVVAADRVWADRLVRISRREDGAAVLWLRDFSLVPEQIGRTVQSLIDEARHEGLSLHRIMVNGHPVWQATHQQGNK